MIKDSAFQKVITYKKYQDIYRHKSINGKKVKSIEVILARCLSIVLGVLLLLAIQQCSNTEINDIIRELTKDIAIALIGFLGFIVTGLAILTSAISNKVVNIIKNMGKIEKIERILLSFYLLGFVTATSAVALLSLYIISYFTKSINYIILFSLSVISIYHIVFILYYSVALIGNCIEIFFIINNIGEEKETKFTNEQKIKYDSFRLLALERIVLMNGDINQVKEYRRIIEEAIQSQCIDDREKEAMMLYIKEVFGE